VLGTENVNCLGRHFPCLVSRVPGWTAFRQGAASGASGAHGEVATKQALRRPQRAGGIAPVHHRLPRLREGQMAKRLKRWPAERQNMTKTVNVAKSGARP
jgi:hypothetical protein